MVTHTSLPMVTHTSLPMVTHTSLPMVTHLYIFVLVFQVTETHQF